MTKSSKIAAVVLFAVAAVVAGAFVAKSESALDKEVAAAAKASAAEYKGFTFGGSAQ